ncbi:MAG: hypothetical protein K5984_04665, partial [Bacteroidales bacterium]|nr:hypothetical protein [Bacteroidales bacterium]
RINTYTAPKHSVKARNSYALDYSFYFRNDYEGIYAVTNETIEANQENTNPNLFVGNLNAAVELYKAEKLGAEEVINVYERNTALIEKAPAKDEIEKAGLDEKKSALENLFISSKVASCENLIALFTPRYEATPDDYDLMNNIVRMMNTAENCADNDLYLNAVTAMYRISPTYKSAYGLYRLNYARNNIDDAVKYLKEAIASEESTAEEDSDYYYELALCLFRNGKNADAYAAAQKSVELNDANKGRAYFIMGQIWGSTVCGGNDIERRAPMWVAVDYLQKAKAADESLTEDANRLISQYAAYYPQAAEAFMYDIQSGQSYTVSCGGMRATTTVRTQK